MTRSLISAALVVALFGGLAACGEGEEIDKIKDGLSQTWDGVKEWTAKKRGEAETFFSESLDGLEGKLAAAKEKAAAAGDDAAARLQARWDDASKKLGELKSAGEGEWEKARDAFAAAYEAFQKELEAAEGR